jgi:hypothetical protein
MVWAATAALTLSVSSVYAAGGGSIATAPTAVYGQQQFGNTATDAPVQGGYARSWWLLSATAGDAITIDWEGPNNGNDMDLYRVGTTDFTFSQGGPLASSGLNSNNKAELALTVPATGSMPLLFSTRVNTENAGPYNFTAYVRHAVNLSLPPVSTLDRSGSIAVSVRNPDGAPISDPAISVFLQVKPRGSSEGYFGTIGAASPVAGTATVSYALPDGVAGPLDVRAYSKGQGYLDAASATLAVTGAAMPVPPPVVVPPTPVARTISISRVNGRYRGRISASDRACVRSVKVELRRKSTGAKSYGSATSRSDGSWTISRRKVKGKVYAAVAGAPLGGLLCSGASSPFVGH